MATWKKAQDESLCELIRSGQVDFTNRSRAYLIEVTRDHFPTFIGNTKSLIDNAMRRLLKKFQQWELNQTLEGE